MEASSTPPDRHQVIKSLLIYCVVEGKKKVRKKKKKEKDREIKKEIEREVNFVYKLQLLVLHFLSFLARYFFIFYLS
jgi:hypothetical protein